MNKKALAVTFAALLTANAQADTVGLYLGSQIWQSDASGTFGERNTLIDFNLEKEQQINYFVAVEHPLPFIPNVRISSTSLDTDGKATLTQAFSFDEKAFAIGDNVNARFNVSYIDYTLYYELLDNRKFSFDLGLTARDFNGDVTISGATETSDGTCNDPNPSPDSLCVDGGASATPIGKIKTDDIEPMLYVATDVSIPMTGLSVFGQGDFSLIGDHSIYDYQVGLSFDAVESMTVDLNVTLGYRVVKMDLEDLNNLYTELEFKGAFVGVIAHF